MTLKDKTYKRKVEHLLTVLQSQSEKKLISILKKHDKEYVASLFNEELIVNYLNSDSYKDDNFLYPFYPEFIRKNKRLIKYYYLNNKSLLFPHLPTEYKNKVSVIKKFLKLDPLNYKYLSEEQKSNLDYLKIVFLGFKKFYSQIKKSDHYSIMGISYEEGYVYEVIPKDVKIKLNINNYHVNKIEFLYKDVLSAISTIKSYEKLNKSLTLNKHNNYNNISKI